jgi:hypothetical protein
MSGNRETSELERHYGGGGGASDQGRSHTASPDVVAKVISDNDRAADNAGRSSSSARRPSSSPLPPQDIEDDNDHEIDQSFSVAVEISPIASLFLACAVGYAIGWMIYGRRKTARSDTIPDYARKRA